MIIIKFLLDFKFVEISLASKSGKVYEHSSN